MKLEKDHEPLGHSSKDPQEPQQLPYANVGFAVYKIVYYIVVFPIWWVAEEIVGLFISDAQPAHYVLSLFITLMEVILVIALIKFFL